MRKNKKLFNFNEEMGNDLEDIKRHLRSKFNIEPSNTSILNLLMQSYKNSNINISRKNKTKNKFIIKI